MARYPKLNAAAHYIISRCQPADLGATKLNKILWFADVEYFERYGKSITGDEYVKRQFGPVPKHAPMATRELEESGLIVSREVDYFGKPKKEFWSLQEADITGFDPNAIAIIDKMIDWVCIDHTATSISDKTHNILWESAEMGEVIPLGAALAYRSAEITEEDIAWAYRELEAAE
ncbi:Panacea domain-containing protein [Mesorhizobium sp. LHD-90]|uniref:Panacea domain-containing protein n=1 Tax=Mesorhizobium sp. LHD-90 TaxID=3071414 RepID=UPI0027E079C7|nr:Panacea domain-containing protein [Mesorhizobium sp. LHD-90]MDQ6435660.1 Panacea domain-containing protein [Mesorhizobium sp. LHD-90]